MSNIDKQWLQQKIAEIEDTRDDIPFGLGEDDSNTLAALRIALASLEAEAVGEVVLGEYDDCGCHPDARVECIAADGQADWENFKDGTRLYTAPPAPVVPDMKELVAILDWILMLPCPTPKATLMAKRLAVVIDACRDAMLQVSDGNSPVIAKAYDIEAFGVFSATEGENGLMLQIERFRFGSEKCPQIGKENMVPKFALQAIINRLQEHCDSMLNEALVDILSMPAAPQQEV
ncbi:hypothetical protein [Escherichia coli]|uniref:hypothetical protein n=1 Tax=Escherichia coli TaxID=562 RepID=UPI00390B7333|nr:hypothetical protein [Escherichia coli]